MPLEMLSARTRCSAPFLVLLLVVSLWNSAGLVQMASADRSESENSPVVLNFHAYSLIYHNSNASIFVYNGADTNPPTYATPLTTAISCSSSSVQFLQFLPPGAQEWFAGVNVWLGMVSWVTQPLVEDMTIRGDVNMTVWMSSPDPEVTASGYIFGILEVDNTASPIGEPAYAYYYNYGSVLGPSPTPYRLMFSADRSLAKGHLIAFFVVVASTSESWRYQVYFDSASTNSFVALPVLSVPVPEFSQIWIALGISFVVLSYLMTSRRSFRRVPTPKIQPEPASRVVAYP